MKYKSKEKFFIGLSLSNSANYDSSICVLDDNNEILYLDKFYYTQDIELFFKNSSHISNSILCASVPQDNTLLEGKWRIHCKNYKMLDDKFKINKSNWTKRLSTRLCEALQEENKKGIDVYRCDINHLRQAFGLNAHFLNRTSLDCKNLQSLLKLKYNFHQLPDNMFSASSLESIICAMFSRHIAQGGETIKLYDFEGLKVLSKPFEN